MQKLIQSIQKQKNLEYRLKTQNILISYALITLSNIIIMKAKTLLTICPAMLTLSWLFLLNQPAIAEILQIGSKLETDPLVVSGTSGGNVSSNCGNIPETPHQVLQLNNSLPYLRLTVESTDKPTLLIDGPGGKFCVLPDTYAGSKPEISGFWQKGTYNLYIGQLIPVGPNYTLSISQQKK